MALQAVHPLNERFVCIYMTDTSSVQAGYAVTHWGGKIAKVYAVLQGQTIGTANNVLTLAINGVAVTLDAAWTQLTSGSAAGDVATAIPNSGNSIVEGDKISVTSDGGGSNTCPTMIYIVIKGN